MVVLRILNQKELNMNLNYNLVINFIIIKMRYFFSLFYILSKYYIFLKIRNKYYCFLVIRIKVQVNFVLVLKCMNYLKFQILGIKNRKIKLEGKQRLLKFFIVLNMKDGFMFLLNMIV